MVNYGIMLITLKGDGNMDLNELLNQTITEETPEAVQIELEPKVEVKESILFEFRM